MFLVISALFSLFSLLSPLSALRSSLFVQLFYLLASLFSPCSSPLARLSPSLPERRGGASLLGPLGSVLGSLGASWCDLRGSWRVEGPLLGGSWGAVGSLLGGLEGVLGRSWSLLGRSWAVIGGIGEPKVHLSKICSPLGREQEFRGSGVVLAALGSLFGGLGWLLAVLGAL